MKTTLSHYSIFFSIAFLLVLSGCTPAASETATEQEETAETTTPSTAPNMRHEGEHKQEEYRMEEGIPTPHYGTNEINMEMMDKKMETSENIVESTTTTTTEVIDEVVAEPTMKQARRSEAS